MSVHKEVKRVTVHVVQAMKMRNEKISMLTAYDYSMAKILDAAGIDVLLVGDSASDLSCFLGSSRSQKSLDRSGFTFWNLSRKF
jgi:2-keto-3-deoxy-L-rhamnonate aldolase RhmA